MSKTIKRKKDPYSDRPDLRSNYVNRGSHYQEKKMKSVLNSKTRDIDALLNLSDEY